MAATTTNEIQCTTCGKGRAILLCEECLQSFCRIHLLEHHRQLCKINIKWIQNGREVAGGNPLGEPWGLCVDSDQTIYVTDRSNHQIVEFKKDATIGTVVAGGNGAGNQNNQLNYPTNVVVDEKNDFLFICDHRNQRIMRWPRLNGTSGEPILSKINCWDLAMDNDGCLYISDISKNEVRRYKIGETKGTLVAGGSKRGSRLNQLNGPYLIFVDQDHSVYISDHNNYRVMKWIKNAKEGIIVAGGHGEGNALTQLLFAYGIAVDPLGTVYIADYGNNRVIRWLKGAKEGCVVIDGNRQEAELNRLNYPVNLSFDQQNNLYIVDSGNH